MKDQTKKRGVAVSPAQQARLVAFHDTIYTQAKREAQGGMFELINPKDQREDNDALIAAAQATLHALGHPETMLTAVSLLLLTEGVRPLGIEQLCEAFSEEVACLVEASRAIGEPGNADDWHASLEKFTQASADCQTLRMALIQAAIDRSHQPSPQMDFWYTEALALPAANPGLRARVIARLETDLAVLYAR